MNENLALSNNPSMPEKFSEEITPSETNQSTEDSTNQVPDPTTPTPSDDDFIKLSRKDLQNEIDRLRREDSDFAQVYNRDIGNKAKSRYQPEIDALRRNLEAQQLLVRRAEYAALTQEQVNERFKSDPQFAADYAKVTHATEPQIVTEFNPQEVTSAVSSVMAFAQRVLTPEQLATIQFNINADKYDKDEAGNPYTQFSWREGLERLQDDIVAFTKSAQQVETPKPSEPPRQDTARPDMSNGSSVNSNNQGKYTIQQVRSMPWEEQFRRWPDGYEKAIENGEIIVPGLNDR